MKAGREDRGKERRGKDKEREGRQARRNWTESGARQSPQNAPSAASKTSQCPLPVDDTSCQPLSVGSKNNSAARASCGHAVVAWIGAWLRVWAGHLATVDSGHATGIIQWGRKVLINSEVDGKLGVEEGGWRERRTDRETERQMEAETAAARTQTDRHVGKSDRELEEDVCLGPEVPPGLWL